MTTFLRPKPFGTKFFGTTDYRSVMNKVPRYKFMFYARFILSDHAYNYMKTQEKDRIIDLGSWQNGISFKIYSIDKPSVDLTTTTLNQYNRKRNVYSKLDYHPLNIKIYDTPDDITLSLWKNYYMYYFGDGRYNSSEKQLSYESNVTDPAFLDALNWGLNPERENTYFFQRVELYAIFGHLYTQINVINPKISKVDWQNFDYNSSDPSEMSLSLNFEAIEYLSSKYMSSTEKELFGFDFQRSFDPPGTTGVSPQAENISKPSTSARDLVAGLLNNRPKINPTDLSASITNSFRLANSTLNLFTDSYLGVVSNYAGSVIGQTTQGQQVTAAVLNNTTNPGIVSGYVGPGFGTGQSASPGVLNQYGIFDFGGSSTIGV